MKIKPLSIVYHIMSGKLKRYVYFGNIPNMPGHSLTQELETGKPAVLHTENLYPFETGEI